MKLDKKGRSEIEGIINAIFGFIVIIALISTLATSGVFNEIINSLTSAWGLLGAVLGILIILAIIKAILEAFK